MARRTRDDWTAVALRALAEGGVPAVAVEPLAARLGATKGSAYWHFPNRAALLAATLERWEREHTEAVIGLVEAVPDPLDRLRLLFGTVLERAGDAAVEAAMLAARDDPAVAPVLRRVTDRRVEYLTGLFGELGFAPGTARRRALLAYSVYVGQVHLLVAAPHVTGDRQALLEEALAAVTGRG
ncbi:TetR/AcrR family transcriptional regulator [Saccharothrix longispora]|uniref:TetR/AcrR family transcriptional regulator n=1 Tax=Saccharothrix longispora TaxID=33920 RepID=UPI0028FD2F34|nr:TetR/AcrR family transcriptional regulator [Saccharothrix longispora]MBY8847540.1 TetR/AcrR family transcriptional regulator [Saccharothrix sp. MB29]MDU0291296.1 TetR/AcrR family transcriptional regulator [Saccharothrix longispora]